MKFKHITEGELPTRLILQEDGTLRLSDGGCVVTYLKEFRDGAGVKGDLPVCMIAKESLQQLFHDSYMWRVGRGA